jgi:hypothetical protein
VRGREGERADFAPSLHVNLSWYSYTKMCEQSLLLADSESTPFLNGEFGDGYRLFCELHSTQFSGFSEKKDGVENVHV